MVYVMEQAIPSMQLDETLFDDANWVHNLHPPDNAADVDVFALVEGLDLDGDLVFDGNDATFSGCGAQHATQAQHTSGTLRAEQRLHDHKRTPQRKNGQSKELQKVERIRARNREAQARYRQKAKGQAVELESSIATVQGALTRSKQRQHRLQNQHIQLKQKCSNSIAALEAILSVSNLIPAPAVVPSTGQACAQPSPQPKAQAETSNHPAPQSGGTPSSQTTHSLVVKAAARPATDGLFSPPPASAEFRPLSSFRHFKRLSLSMIDPHAYPKFSEPSDEFGFDSETCYASCDAPSVTGRVNWRHLANDYRVSEAQKLGCDVSDVGWFIQTHVDAYNGGVFAQNGPMNLEESSDSQWLSHSTTFSTGPCVASFVLLYLLLCTENSACVKAMDVLQGAAPEDVANSLFACEIDDVSSYYSSGSAKSSRTSYTSKRRRGANSSILTSTPRHKPLKSTAELLSTIGLTNAHIDSCNVRCGVGKLMPLRPVVERLLRRTVVKFSDILPLELQRLCFEQAIETIDRMLMGFHEALTVTKSSSHQTCSGSMTSEFSDQGSPAAQATSNATPFPNPGSESEGHTADQGRSESDISPPGTAEAAAGGTSSTLGSPESNGALFKERNLHSACTILAVRAEMMKLLEDMPAVIAASSKSEKLASKAQMLRENTIVVYDCCFAEILACMDTPNLVMSMCMNAFTPFIGSYYMMDNLNVQRYKKLGPNTQQRQLMAEFWLSNERRKRRLDSHMHAACTLLTALPSNIPLPLDFFSHLNSILSPDRQQAMSATSAGTTTTTTSCTTGLTHTSLSQQLLSAFSRNHTATHMFEHLEETAFNRPNSQTHSFSGSLLSCSMDVESIQHPLSFGRQHSSLSVSQHSCSTAMDGHISSDQPEVRFMGQHAEDMVRAEMALRELRVMQDLERDLHVDVLNAEVPGVLLQLEKQLQAWADHFMSQLMPPDFMELCQIAATQQNRFSLFGQPFK